MGMVIDLLISARKSIRVFPKMLIGFFKKFLSCTEVDCHLYKSICRKSLEHFLAIQEDQ